MDETFQWSSEAEDILCSDADHGCHLFHDYVGVQDYHKSNHNIDPPGAIATEDETSSTTGATSLEDLNEVLVLLNRIQKKCKQYKMLDKNRVKLQHQLEGLLLAVLKTITPVPISASALATPSSAGAESGSTTGATISVTERERQQDLSMYVGITCFLSSVYNRLYGATGYSSCTSSDCSSGSSSSFESALLYIPGTTGTATSTAPAAVGTTSEFQNVLLQQLKLFVRTCIAMQQDRNYETECTVSETAASLRTNEKITVGTVEGTIAETEAGAIALKTDKTSAAETAKKCLQSTLLPLIAEIDEIVTVLLLNNQHGATTAAVTNAIISEVPVPYEPFAYTPPAAAAVNGPPVAPPAIALTADLIQHCYQEVYAEPTTTLRNSSASMLPHSTEWQRDQQLSFEERAINQLFSELVVALTATTTADGTNNGSGGDGGSGSGSGASASASASVAVGLQYNSLFRLLQLQLLNSSSSCCCSTNDNNANNNGGKNSTRPAEISPLAVDLLNKQHNSLSILHKCLSLCMKYAPYECPGL